MIRGVKHDDLYECVNVICESFLTIANEFGFTKQNAPRFTAFSMTESKLCRQLADEKYLMHVYCDNSCIVGYYSLTLESSGECELNNLCTRPSYRHKGIGTTLLAHAIETAKTKNCTKINIGIVEENQRIRKWYEEFGFVHVGTRKFDFFPFTCGYMEKQL